MAGETDKTVLIVDDSSTNVLLLQAILSDKGFHVEAASTVREAQAILLRKRPRVILLDLLMPKISGAEFLALLKNHEKTKSIPVIIVSAVDDELNEERLIKLGAFGYIRKPVDIQTLIRVISEALQPA